MAGETSLLPGVRPLPGHCLEAFPCTIPYGLCFAPQQDDRQAMYGQDHTESIVHASQACKVKLQAV